MGGVINVAAALQQLLRVGSSITLTDAIHEMINLFQVKITFFNKLVYLALSYTYECD